MVYNTQNYWVSEFFPSSDTLENRKHDVSETGSVSVLSRCLLPHSLEDGNRSSFRNIVFSILYNTGRWKKSRNPVILCSKEQLGNISWPIVKKVKQLLA
jgi:hypothetical protein